MKYYNSTKFLISVLVCLLGYSLMVGSASGEPSFKGKTVRMVLGARVGGGTDRAGRLVGQFLGKYLRGSPQIILQNMPGGGGVKASNYFVTRVKPDGLTILMGANTSLDHFRLRNPAVKYDPLKFEYVGALNRGGTVVMVRKDAHKRLMDRTAKPVIVGAITGTRSWNAMVLWAAEFIGWNVKWVVGYPGSAALAKAIRQGEIDLTANSNAFLLHSLVDEGAVDLLTQTGVFSA